MTAQAPGAHEPALRSPRWVAFSRSHSFSGPPFPLWSLDGSCSGRPQTLCQFQVKAISEQQEVARPFGKFGDCGHSSRQIVGSDAGYWTGDRAGSLEAWGGVSGNVTSCSALEDWLIWLVTVWLASQVAPGLGSPGSIGGPQGLDSLPEVSVRSQKKKVQPKAPT